MAWGNAPVCDSCWRERKQERVPYRMVEPEAEVCVDCGKVTTSGIYVRMQLDEGPSGPATS